VICPLATPSIGFRSRGPPWRATRPLEPSRSLDAAAIGDSKVIWELNRHQWLVGLGQAYRLTGDERFADMFATTLREWQQANPPGMGINWASSLEAAFRLISWSWALSLFRGSTALSPELRADLVQGIVEHAARIERYLSHYFSPNTHLTGEALGLFYTGVLFPLLPAARRWRRIGRVS
jgi:Heparinase II/III N-terminus